MNVLVNGLVINYRDIGKGKKTIFFLHGWASDSAAFNGLINSMGSQYRCITVDLPGFGKSQVPAEALTMADFADFVTSFLNKIKAKPDILIAHSNGGAIAINAVSSGKIKPKKMVLIASSGLREGRKLKKTVYKMIAKPAKAGLIILPEAKRTRIKKKLYGKIGSDYMIAENMKETFKNIVSYDIAGEAKAISVPTLLIYGSEDKATPLVMGRRLSDLIKGSELKIVDGAGHFVHQAEPEKAIAYIEEFIR